ncbi:MAG: class I SAM-dependent methyltransferase, partial [Betaproteobacteria bacterium]
MDRWLDRWLPLIAERNQGRGEGDDAAEILELGCGGGLDTEALISAGNAVVAIDRSADAIAKARLLAPTARFFCQDIRDNFPAAHSNVIVASLSLHYFSWTDTLALVSRIHATLPVGGLLFCRLNSVNDIHYGATGHALIEKNYFLVNGEPKRFFDESDVNRMFSAGWRRLHIEETIVHRYQHPKSAWEVVMERFA